MLFLLALGRLAVTVWRQNRGTFGLMPLRSRILLYGSVVGIVLLIVTADLWASSSAARRAALLRRARRLGYVLYRGWQESRRYYY